MTRNWPLGQRLKSGKSSTGFTVSKIELLVKHIAVFRAELARVSHMVQELELQLAELSNIIEMKNKEVI